MKLLNYLALPMLMLASVVPSAFAQFGDQALPDPQELIDIHVAADASQVAPGDSFYVLVSFKLEPKYHIYWKSPGMSGVAPSLTWDLPKGVSAKETYWPIPKPFKVYFGEEYDLSFGYEDTLTIVQRIDVDKDVPAGELTLKVDVMWQICKEACLTPVTTPKSVAVTVGTAKVLDDAVRSEVEAILKSSPKTVETWSVDVAVEGDLLKVMPKGGDVSTIKSLIFMPYDNNDTVDLAKDQIWKDGVLTISLQKDRQTDTPSGVLVRETPWEDGGSRGLKIRLASDGGKPVEMVATPKAVEQPEEGTLIDAGHGFVFLDAKVDELPFDFVIGGQVENESGIGAIIKYVILAFLGGLILNVMPCVLPVLSIKAMSIVNHAHQDRKEIFKGSMAYTIGVLASFLVLATLVAITKAAGKSAGWGDHMQNPVFVIILFIVIWVFALSLFDMFIIQLPGMQKANEMSGKTGHLGSFLSGIFAVLLSTPCTAPLLGSAVGFLFAQSIPVIYVSFIAIGLGLALPFILLGLTPAAIKWIPKPGGWMNVFREVMGFFLIGTAVFLAYILQSQLGDHFFPFVIFVVPLTFACWLYGKAAGPGVTPVRNLVVLGLAIAIVIGSGALLVRVPKVNHANANLTGELMRKALQDENRLVFIDFGAEWCATCKFMEKTVLYSDDVQAEFKEKNVLLIKGDFTNRDPKINKWLERFNRVGVPLYVVLRPGPTISAEILPTTITKQLVIDKLNE